MRLWPTEKFLHARPAQLSHLEISMRETKHQQKRQLNLDLPTESGAVMQFAGLYAECLNPNFLCAIKRENWRAMHCARSKNKAFI
jgi:hypothetical protein